MVKASEGGGPIRDNAVYQRCGEEEETPDHIMFRCRNIRRVKDERGRRKWAREVGVR